MAARGFYEDWAMSPFSVDLFLMWDKKLRHIAWDVDVGEVLMW